MSIVPPPPFPTPCASDPDLMFDPLRIDEAQEQCVDCYFIEECRIRSAGEEFGVWAGEIKPGTLAETPAHRAVMYAELETRLTELLAAGGTYRSIGRDYGVADTTVRRMAQRQDLDHLRAAS